MDQHFNWSVAKKSCMLSNILFLIVHCCLITFFYHFNITGMVRVNMISIPIYILGCFIIGKNMIKTWFWIMSLEVVIHMAHATVSLGLDYGFHYCLIGMVSIFFYGEYFSIKMHRGTINGSFLGLISAAVMLFLEVYCFIKPPLYQIDNPYVAIVIKLIMVVMVFFFVVSTMRMMLMHSFTVEERLSKKADYDELTKLPNRHYMSDVFETIFNDGSVEEYWVAMLDIDDFKKINDTYGHKEGDNVLRMIAEVLLDTKHDVQVCRWGGEEFLIIGKKESKDQSYLEDLEHLRREIEARRIQIGDEEVAVTVTIGVSEYKKNSSIEDWISFADKRLYVGKYNGKNQVVG